jgi:hypothetical protein
MINQRKVSTHTLASYRDTFRLLLKFAAVRGSKRPACLQLADLAAPTVMEFLDSLETQRHCAISNRNQGIDLFCSPKRPIRRFATHRGGGRGNDGRDTRRIG